jgi:hypothetical protein
MPNRKLGRKPVDPKRYAQVPHIMSFAADAAPALVADSCDYKRRMSSAGGSLGNDRYGCCGFAGFGHLKQSICANLGLPCDVNEELVLRWYSECTGFKPSDPSTDGGVYLIDALRYFMGQGLIVGYGRVDVGNPAAVARAIELFGGLYMGFGLPIAWQSTDVWDAGPSVTGSWKPWSWGGHCVSAHTYDAETDGQIVTWGNWVTGTAAGREVYCDEGYALILPELLDAKGKTLQGFDLDALRVQLELVD